MATETVGDTATSAKPAAAVARNFDLLFDIPLDVTVELGRARLPLRELLLLAPGAVVELTKAAGEPLDLLINGKPIARGEAVMLNGRLGVRLTQVIRPSERVTGLK